MPIDQRKVKDILRHQNVVRSKIVSDVTTYEKHMECTNFESGVLTYAQECAQGDMRDLLDDIGINNYTIPYTGFADWGVAKAGVPQKAFSAINVLKNARYTLIDMTDYEYERPSPNEIDGMLPMRNLGYLHMIKDGTKMSGGLSMHMEDTDEIPKNLLGKYAIEGWEDHQ